MRINVTPVDLLLAVLLFAPNVARAQATTDLSSEQKTKIDAIFANYDKPGSPGCALGLIKDGQLIYARGYGMANLEHGIANSPKLVFDIGSTSKQFAAASIILLAQQGKLALDDEVRKWIPELPQYQQPVRIRHLLHHTSGIRDYTTLFSLAGVNFDDTTTDEDALKAIVRQKELNFTPGDEWLYSNSGFFLLSVIVKRASGKSLAEFAKEQIFDPLGMNRTLFLDNHKRIVPWRATGYSPAPKGGFQIEMSNFEQTGDGAVQTSVEDLLLWDRNFYEPKIGGAAFLKQMLEVGKFNNGKSHDYASGLMVNEYKGLRRVSHSGAWAGYRAELMRFPEQKVSIACLCNLATTNPSGLAQQVADIYLAEAIKAAQAQAVKATSSGSSGTPAATVVIEPEKLQAKVGLYRSPTTGELRRITFRDGQLRIDPLTPGSRELRPTSETQFSVANTPNHIEFIAVNNKWQLKLKTGAGADDLLPVEAFAPSVEKLGEFSSTYYSEELDTSYKLSVESGKLVTANRNGVKRTLQPTFTDAFLAGGLQFVFQRNAKGEIESFRVQAGRTRNLLFVKQKP
jgi:CubicO group peptidase (beta-lactamase class C family)